MRQLLERWAELEPERCERSGGVFTIQAGEEIRDTYYSEEHGPDLAWIQWAVQAAIVSQGWRYNLECYPITGICEGVVFLSPVYTRRRGSNPAEALLSAYLVVLEAER